MYLYIAIAKHSAIPVLAHCLANISVITLKLDESAYFRHDYLIYVCVLLFRYLVRQSIHIKMRMIESCAFVSCIVLSAQRHTHVITQHSPNQLNEDTKMTWKYCPFEKCISQVIKFSCSFHLYRSVRLSDDKYGAVPQPKMMIDKNRGEKKSPK